MPSEKTSSSADFPIVVKEIARVMGWPATIRLVKTFGGCNLHVPVRTRQGPGISSLIEVLVESIGQEATEALCGEHGGSYLYIPRCAATFRELRNARIRAEYDRLSETLSSGRVTSILARHFELSYRAIEGIINRPSPSLSPQLVELIGLLAQSGGITP